jgi:hypothetical protein
MYMRAHLRVLWVAVGAVVFVTADGNAQWLNYPTPGTPRTADGQPDLSAATPRTADGKPDLSGIWNPWGLSLGGSAALTRGAVFQPWAEALSGQRIANDLRDSPEARCLPQGMPKMVAGPMPLKVVQTRGLIVVLYEEQDSFRQIFLDGRPLPHDPQPTWRGYSTAHWEGDDLVVETIGLNGKAWLDSKGHPLTGALRVTERYTRRDFGHLSLQVTFDDRNALEKPWTSAKMEYTLMPDTDILERVCLENEKDVVHFVGK